jgi:hypothetical protein
MGVDAERAIQSAIWTATVVLDVGTVTFMLKLPFALSRRGVS